MDQICVNTDQLRIGLYVANLDRPWLETPFLFQGFRIRDEDEIAELRKYCQSVYVDIEQSDLSEIEQRALRASAQQAVPANRERQRTDTTQRKRAINVPEPDLTRTGQYYLDTEKLGKELERAQGIQRNATAAVSQMMDGIRNGHALDVPQLEEVVDPLVDSVLRNRDAMAWLTRIRATDEYVYQHSIGSSVWAVVFGRHLGFDRDTLVAVGLGGMLLDVGKTKIPLDILRKAGSLTPEEMALMRRHVEFGLDIIAEAGNVDPRVEIMLATHHERFDGNGYPHNLSGTGIPVLGRIAGIVDTYDAMVTQRPYRNAVSTFDAMRNLQHLAKKEFQGEMIDQFVQAVGMFPTGSLVELNTGEVGVVVAQNNYQRLRPEVMVILDSDKNPCADFRSIDLRLNGADANQHESLWIDRGLETGAFGIDPSEYFL
ncbi:MAG TPA: HD-GYP domain-containing protein [Woeseiaceae bacterium]|nr:HD-GYP domain-containing protein [Woeseiaceae bacterium]